MAAILHCVVVGIENYRITNLINIWRDESKIKIKYLFNLWKFKIKYFPILKSIQPCLICDDYMHTIMDETWKGICSDCFHDRRWRCGLCNKLFDGDELESIYWYNEWEEEEQEKISCKECISSEGFYINNFNH
tara:strand:- start:739 stop:1137 length:399 start_codon:yes stop_codon:yes gene_type:complete